MENRTGITIEAIKEALEFINLHWGDWEGDFDEFMANVISDDRVTSFDVKHVIDALSKGQPIEGLEGLEAKRQGLNYKVNFNP